MRYKVDVGELQAGMYVTELDRPWVGTPFLFQGFLIETDEELAQLKSICKYVIVDEAQSKVPVDKAGTPLDADAGAGKTAAGGTPAAAKPIAPPPPITSTGVRNNVGQLLAGVQKDNTVDIKESQRIVARLIQQSKNQNLLMQMFNLRNKQNREAGHSLNTAILAIAFGRHLGQSEERLQLLGLGAILHDIGKTRIPAEILNKPAKLSDDELAAVKRHPDEGYEMLTAAGNVPNEVLNMVRLHHERVDGSGYPQGLKGNDVPLSVGIISIADAYETLTADNPYQAALTPVEALQRLRTTGIEGFGKELLQDFMRFVGLYPIGSVVRLSSGEIAVVFSADPKTRMRPLVLVVRNPAGAEIRPPKLVNLAILPESKLAIIDIVHPSKLGIDTNGIFEKELAI
ncbi:MAG: HD-GYP domain-containing protein [Gammaproteobacteria bacterium]|nr:HD-GYP domain-containing protein [Gammaproteobacteria bacterium]MDE2346095.1 HD-GYP domain-containing protein [Gammaproteobacteria bacterium]